ncbi:MAG TPA: ferritin-like domain-containing protein [Steroidobacteraceae bacterium]|jgi:bacterioferritin
MELPAQAAAAELSDVVTLRQAPRQKVDNGTLASARGADRHTVLRLLNEALATELVCTLRCRRHYFMAFGRVVESVRQEFLERAQQELAHADRIAARIVELNGEPDLNPRGLTERSHAEYTVGDTLESMIREDLVAKRIAIDSYRQMLSYLGARDPVTRRLMEEILASEEAHVEDLASLLQEVSSGAGRSARS